MSCMNGDFICKGQKRKRASTMKTGCSGNKRKRASMMMIACRGKKKRNMASSLNQDMIFSILTKLPSKSLMRFRLACKSWDSFISDPHFINLRLQQQRKKPGILMLSQVRYTNTLRFHRIELESPPPPPPSPVNFLFEKEVPLIEHSPIMYQNLHQCDGLLVFQSLSQIIVCNPATRELLSLPQSENPDILLLTRSRIDTVGFGFDRSTNMYKIVRVFYRSMNESARSYSLGMEMFTLGLGGGSSNSTWRQLEDPPYPVLDKCAAHAHGAVYWIIWNELHFLSPKAILGFNLSDEKFRLIDPPLPFRSDPLKFQKARLIDIQGNLFGLHCCRETQEFSMWMMDKEEKWTLSYRFRLSPPDYPNTGLFAIHRGKLFHCCEESIYAINSETRSSLEIIDNTTEDQRTRGIVTSEESLVPIDWREN